MTKDELQKRFRCGAIEGAFENSRWLTGFMRVLFTLVGMYFFWLMLGERTLVERLDNIAVLFFCLWRIHRQRDIMCYITAKGLIVRRQCLSPWDYYNEEVHDEKNLVFLPYKDIFYIADSWQEIELGQAEEGGIAVLPVRLQFLSKKHKQQIMDKVKEVQEEKSGK